jgi:hypothetical protein
MTRQALRPNLSRMEATIEISNLRKRFGATVAPVRLPTVRS